MVAVHGTMVLMDGTTRSSADRQRSVLNTAPSRAQFQLLSDQTRREPGERHAGGNPLPPGFDPDLSTGRPGLVDLMPVCTAVPIQLDLTRPHRTWVWIAGRVLRETIGPLRGNVRFRVARRRKDGVVGAAAFNVLGPDLRWHLESLLVQSPDDGAAVDAVLRRGVIDAGSAGARRVFARLPGDDIVDAALRRSGFVPYQHESVFVLNDDSDRRELPSSRVRRVHPADVWGVHQLYLEVVPRQVQYADAVTSRLWEGSRPLKPGARRASGWVIEDNGRIRGYARVSTLEDPHVARLDLLIDPDMRLLAVEVIRAATNEARNLHGVPCVTSLPGYSQELSQALQEAGFFHTGDQTAWVCYTTVPARSYIVAVELGTPATVESQRSRVPGLGGAGMTSVEYGDRGGAVRKVPPAPHETHA